jgi:hypothetical protein
VITLVTPTVGRNLTTLAAAKVQVGVAEEVTTFDTTLTTLIQQASSQIERWAGRPLYRAQWLEKARGNQLPVFSLGRWPVATLDGVTYQGSAVTDVVQSLPEVGLLHRPAGFSTVGDPLEWAFTTTAGWLLPDVDVDGSVSVLASDDSYNGTFTPLLKAGDILTASGFTDAANNGIKVIVSATTSKIIVQGSLVDEAVATRVLRLRNLPEWVERAALDFLTISFQGERDPALTALKVGDASMEWRGTQGLQTQYQRIRYRVSSLSRPGI